MSFCKDGDSLPMWNYYAQTTGISIGFDNIMLPMALNSSIMDSSIEVKTVKTGLFEEVLYDEQVIYDKIKEEVKNLIDKDDDILYTNKLYSISEMMKNKCFEYEKEYRLLSSYNPNDKYSVYTMVTETNIKPYVKLKLYDLWRASIKKIIILGILSILMQLT